LNRLSPSGMENQAKVYFLPTLMTGSNLASGFASTLCILHSMPLGRGAPDKSLFGWAIAFIVAACVFDFLDGLLARLCSQESTFGREFDSLADLVSFGVAPALLVYCVVLKGFSHSASILSTVYLLCGALRLARFNCVATTGKTSAGLPIPAAAGLIASLSWFLLSLSPGERQIAGWRCLLPPLMLFISVMMVSRFAYPRLKGLALRTWPPMLQFLVVIVLIIASVNQRWMPATVLIGYLLYGFLHSCFPIKRLRAIAPEQATIAEHEPPPELKGPL
jgi:CDP-diacylglycerol---serine O-phosphatidyltransferase